MSSGGSGYFTRTQTWGKVTRKFKSGGLHERHVVATGKMGTISAFACRHRETKKNLCRGGRSQDLPDTDSSMWSATPRPGITCSLASLL